MEIIVAIVILALFFDYTNGFHDAANVVSTVIATKVLSPARAILMAAVLNFLGATQISGVAQTVATGLINVADTTQIVVLCAIISAIFWNVLTWYYGIPSSSSYALISGLVGAAWGHQGVATILWKGILSKVLIPMVISPLLGFILGIALMKGLYFYLTIHPTASEKRIFRHLQIGSACLVALSHGLNDAQKSMGLITLGLFSGGFLKEPYIPLWVIITCAIMIALGTASGGFRIIRTMAFSITQITPMQGFAAEASASMVILIASFLGMPISSTHVIAGGITGVGTARSIRSVRWSTPRKLLLAWILTLPGAALVGAAVYFITQSISGLWLH
jgi:PiT family inorganic phosphate transporter